MITGSANTGIQYRDFSVHVDGVSGLFSLVTAGIAPMNIPLSTTALKRLLSLHGPCELFLKELTLLFYTVCTGLTEDQ